MAEDIQIPQQQKQKILTRKLQMLIKANTGLKISGVNNN